MNDAELAAQGLTLQAALPKYHINDLLSPAHQAAHFNELLIFASVGSTLWRRLPSMDVDDPIDRFSVDVVLDYLSRINCGRHDLLYPVADTFVDLRELGHRAGWHHNSRLGIGINARVGTWFAYRVVVLADTRLADAGPGEPDSGAPCESCADKPCVTACPAGAVQVSGEFDLDACGSHRLEKNSRCATTCLARLACPVGTSQRYDADQIHYHYTRSLQTLKWYRQEREKELS